MSYWRGKQKLSRLTEVYRWLIPSREFVSHKMQVLDEALVHQKGNEEEFGEEKRETLEVEAVCTLLSLLPPWHIPRELIPQISFKPTCPPVPANPSEPWAPLHGGSSGGLITQLWVLLTLAIAAANGIWVPVSSSPLDTSWCGVFGFRHHLFHFSSASAFNFQVLFPWREGLQGDE